ncbi:aromatic acid exporter family protein [Streptomyces sp. NPDC087843]|uniref:FUSC family protein n=1 Tax=Streptomyces sp. NPDC087843 TaxID=3365804 RepID=UPI0037FCF592
MPKWDCGPGKVKVAVLGAAGYVRQAVRAPGGERDDLLLSVKTVVAAMIAWMLTRQFLPPAVATFAPFTAMVTLQATLYRSLRDCVQYLVAISVGATLAATLAAVAGIHGWTFGLLTLVALWLGRVKRLGQHGTQVAVVGFFAFSSGAGRIGYIGHLAASVVIGALCGIVAHLALVPARHTRHRQEAAADLFTGMSRRVDSLADAFDGETPGRDQVRQWRQAWLSASGDCEALHRSIEAEEENGLLNPRQSVGGAAEALSRARDAVTVAQQCLDHLRSITRTLDYAIDSQELEKLPASFRSGLGALLRTVATAMEEMGRTSLTDPGRLSELIDEAADELDITQQGLLSGPQPQRAAPTLQGTLLTDAARLLAELRSDRPALSLR